MTRMSFTNGRAEMDEDEFLLTRAKIHEYFEKRSALEMAPINPTLRDDRTVRLVERLYEEGAPHRAFYICPNRDQTAKLDAFTKKTGVRFEVTLLHVSTCSEERHFPTLWQAYVKWMHKGV